MVNILTPFHTVSGTFTLLPGPAGPAGAPLWGLLDLSVETKLLLTFIPLVILAGVIVVSVAACNKKADRIPVGPTAATAVRAASVHATRSTMSGGGVGRLGASR